MDRYFFGLHDLPWIVAVAVVAALVTGIVFRTIEFWSLRITPLTLRERTLRDKIADLERILGEARDRIASLETLVQYLLQELRIRDMDVDKDGEPDPDYKRLVLVAVGPDPMLKADLTSFRSVQTKTNLRFTRVIDVDRERFERHLERHRARGRPIRYVHLSVHAGPNGVQFADGKVDGVWLSEVLKDVEVLVLAGCEASFVGDYLGVVPFVITMAEPIDNHDASVFTELFWASIGNGVDPEAAFYEALDKGPPVLSEFAELHF